MRAQSESADADRPGHASGHIEVSEARASQQVEAEGTHVWVVVDRSPGPDGLEQSAPVAAFVEVKDGLRYMTESLHPMLLVRVPLVSPGWKTARALGLMPESTWENQSEELE